jgi:hypothetical protein
MAQPATRQKEARNTDAEIDQTETAEELRIKFEQALHRIEALETRLTRRLAELDERKAAQGEPSPETMTCSPPLSPPWSQPPQEDKLFSGQSYSSPAGATTLHLHRPVRFEDFRRAQSSQLQSERLRVLVPPSIGMWPLPRK